jgi:hypothetical protein
MASKKSTEERIKEVVAAVLAAEAEADGDAWEHETVDDIEDAMVRIGDLVACEVGVQKFARHTEKVKDDRCPRCGRVEDRDREIITRRGTVPVGEAKYHSHKCRRDFFPSDGAIGN